MPVYKLRPYLKRKLIGCRLMKSEGAPVLQVHISAELWIKRVPLCDWSQSRRAPYGGLRVQFRGHHLLGQCCRDKGAGSDVSFEVPFSHKLFVRMQYWKT